MEIVSSGEILYGSEELGESVLLYSLGLEGVSEMGSSDDMLGVNEDNKIEVS